MRPHARALLALCACGLAIVPASARAMGAAGGSEDSSSPVNDQGSSFHYRSEIQSVTPATRGLSVRVLQFADRLLLVNHTGRTVTIFGYDGEPYARILADGTAEQNRRSPATYLNQSFYGDINVPPQADASAPPSWQVIDRTGQLEWHDHRIHYTSPATPPQVKDKSKRTLIFDWKVPIEIGTSRGTVAGQLFWVPESSKAPLAAILIGVAIVLAGLAFVVFVRRRRSGRPAGGDSGGAQAGREPGSEAW
jgi:hypothetical protein